MAGKFGTNDLDNAMFGSNQVEKIMLGSKEVWSNGEICILVTASSSGIYRVYSANSIVWEDYKRHAWPSAKSYTNVFINKSETMAFLLEFESTNGLARRINLNTFASLGTDINCDASGFEGDKFTGGIFIDNDTNVILHQRYRSYKVRLSDNAILATVYGFMNGSYYTTKFVVSNDESYIINNTKQLSISNFTITDVQKYDGLVAFASNGDYYTILSNTLTKYNSNDVKLWDYYESYLISGYNRSYPMVYLSKDENYMYVLREFGKGIIEKIDVSSAPSNNEWSNGICIDNDFQFKYFHLYKERLFIAAESSNEGLIAEINITTGSTIWAIIDPQIYDISRGFDVIIGFTE